MALAHGVIAQVHVPLQVAGLGAGGGHRPVGITADGDASLATADAVVQDEGLGTAIGDAQAESLDVGIPEEDLGPVARAGLPGEDIGNAFGHGPVNTVSTHRMVPSDVTLRRFTEDINRKARKYWGVIGWRKFVSTNQSHRYGVSQGS
jgi:hypothetical protein